MSVQNNPILYEDSKIKIIFNSKSPEDHIINFITQQDKEGFMYHIPRRCLEELANTNRDELKVKLNTLNDSILSRAYSIGLNVDSVGLAIAHAYIEEKRRYENFAREFKRELKSSKGSIPEEELYHKK